LGANEGAGWAERTSAGFGAGVQAHASQRHSGAASARRGRGRDDDNDHDDESDDSDDDDKGGSLRVTRRVGWRAVGCNTGAKGAPRRAPCGAVDVGA
jgi:hypothetical protein